MPFVCSLASCTILKHSTCSSAVEVLLLFSEHIPSVNHSFDSASFSLQSNPLSSPAFVPGLPSRRSSQIPPPSARQSTLTRLCAWPRGTTLPEHVTCTSQDCRTRTPARQCTPRDSSLWARWSAPQNRRCVHAKVVCAVSKSIVSLLYLSPCSGWLGLQGAFAPVHALMRCSWPPRSGFCLCVLRSSHLRFVFHFHT